MRGINRRPIAPITQRRPLDSKSKTQTKAWYTRVRHREYTTAAKSGIQYSKVHILFYIRRKSGPHIDSSNLQT